MDLDRLRRWNPRLRVNGGLSGGSSEDDDGAQASDVRDRKDPISCATSTTNLARDAKIRETTGSGGGGEAKKRFTYRPSFLAHRSVRESPLSSDAIFKQSHAGLFNLCVVVLLAVNRMLIIEKGLCVRQRKSIQGDEN